MGANALHDVLFIQFAREPVPGMVKTRMLPELSPLQACELHRELVLWTSHTLTASGVGDVELSVAGSTASPLFQQCRAMGISSVRSQLGKGLGERMYRALEEGLQRYCKVILVGSDCPQIDQAYLQGAADRLDDCAVVLGPAMDGGYVLIGVRELDSQWFEGVAWGTESVFEETRANLQASATKWGALPVLQDIDRPEDLPLWRGIVNDSL